MEKNKIFFALITGVFFFSVLRADLIQAQDKAPAGQPPVAEENSQPPAPARSPAQLETLVAPVALYPDPLLSQILVASTYPLELVQAYQWLPQHPELQGQALQDAAARQTWDPSVQALVIFPDVLKRLNADITWTTNLGNAFLADQGSVMDAVQRLRVKAEQAGKLQSTVQEKVITTTEAGQPVVEIQPADPNVIYVPVYNPVWIWGPPEYDYYPAWYYPPPPPSGIWFFWDPAFQMNFYYSGWGEHGGWDGWGWRPGWRHHHVAVNRKFFDDNHYRPVPVVNKPNVQIWVPDPEHRKGGSYPSFAPRHRVSAPREERPVAARPTVVQVRQQFQQKAVTVAAPPAPPPAAVPQRVGNRTITPNSLDRNRSAFGGTDNGPAARAYSNRGHASLAPPAGTVKPPDNSGVRKVEQRGGGGKVEKKGGGGKKAEEKGGGGTRR